VRRVAEEGARRIRFDPLVAGAAPGDASYVEDGVLFIANVE